jgi:hypothetical protein
VERLRGELGRWEENGNPFPLQDANVCIYGSDESRMQIFINKIRLAA